MVHPPPAEQTPLSVTSVAQAEQLIAGICFKTGPPQAIGAEIELLLPGVANTRELARLQNRAPHVTSSSLTWEPGGQLELSSFPATDLRSLLVSLAHDLDVVADWLDSEHLTPLWLGVDPTRPPRRLTDHPRYRAMEGFFDSHEVPCEAPPAGRSMMNATASVQINVDAGHFPSARWQLLHDVGPAMIAAFANSPRWCGLETGWQSNRQLIWQRLHALGPALPLPQEGEIGSWKRFVTYALDAPVMMMTPSCETAPWSSAPGISLRQWIAEPRLGARVPSLEDVRYHLTTLFPPVRPKGWFEVRYLDLPPRDWWRVPIAVFSALCEDDEARPQALEIVRGSGSTPLQWADAARYGLGKESLLAQARALLELSIGRLRRSNPGLAAHVEDYAETFTYRGLAPAAHYRPAAHGRALATLEESA